MSPTNRETDHEQPHKVSAFPVLDENLSVLPTIPGGWVTEKFVLHEDVLTLYKPADPDLFLEDADVLIANQKSDYMPFWAFLWPAAIQMAQAVRQAPWEVGSSVLELGTGLGLVGLSALQRGDQVTFSDYDPTALFICRKNAMVNGLADPEVLQLDWRDPVDRKFQVIIGCEVTYDAPMHPVILDLLEKMLEQSGICWLGDPGRYRSLFFYQLAVERGFRIRILNEHLEELAEPRSQGFQIFELRLR